MSLASHTPIMIKNVFQQWVCAFRFTMFCRTCAEQVRFLQLYKEKRSKNCERPNYKNVKITKIQVKNRNKRRLFDTYLRVLSVDLVLRLYTFIYGSGWYKVLS